MRQKIFIAIVLALAIGVLVFGRQAHAPSELSQSVENTDAEQVLTDNDPIWGDPEAALEMVIFSNFQCPHCAELNDHVRKLQSDWVDTGKLQVQFRDFPISKLVNSLSAHVAASAADNQGQYFEYHHRLYDEQEQWKGLKNPEEYFVALAEELGLDMEQFNADYNDESLIEEITADRDAGRHAGLTGTPGVVINDKYFQGAFEYESLVEELEQISRNLE